VSAGTVAAVVITYQRRDMLRVTLQGLLDQQRPVDEVVVIDNASSDGSAAVLAAEFPTVTHLRMERNLGPAGALHVGLGYAHQQGHRWGWTTSDDIVARPEALRTLLDTAERIGDPRLGLLGCWFEPVSTHFTFNGALWRNRMVLHDLPAVGSPPYRTDIMVFKGTLIALDMVPEVGLPHGHYFLMNEEYEYCLRASRHGRHHYVVPQPLLRPLEEEPPSGYPAWRGYYQARNQLAMILEHRSPGELWWWGLAQAKFVVAALRRRHEVWEDISLRLLGAWHALRGVTGITIDPAKRA
jgi:rhamnopyranosyl-N-acetylglucosaminyl-diphospho-decaprenol beta-1,3/1,4-galactofuranosyltransferase